MSQEEERTRRNFVSVEDLLLKTPLYEEIKIDDRNRVVKEILTYDKAVDIYCPGCRQTATFRGVLTADMHKKVEIEKAVTFSPISGGGGSRGVPWASRNLSKSLVCTRARHLIDYHFVCEIDYLVKVGQYPSLADIEKGDTDKYEAVLGRDRLKELNRAIGLTAHGVGIGAHVYLRRLFESLVEEAHQAAAKAQPQWDENKYQQSRMAERIQLLKGFVPAFLAENPRLYTILSRGIHELTENECLANFDALKLSIEVILDQKLQEKGRTDRAAAARQALAKIDSPGKSV